MTLHQALLETHNSLNTLRLLLASPQVPSAGAGEVGLQQRRRDRHLLACHEAKLPATNKQCGKVIDEERTCDDDGSCSREDCRWWLIEQIVRNSQGA